MFTCQQSSIMTVSLLANLLRADFNSLIFYKDYRSFIYLSLLIYNYDDLINYVVLKCCLPLSFK